MHPIRAVLDSLSQGPRPKRLPPQADRRYRPRLEQLEDRWVPSAVSPWVEGDGEVPVSDEELIALVDPIYVDEGDGVVQDDTAFEILVIEEEGVVTEEVTEPADSLVFEIFYFGGDPEEVTDPVDSSIFETGVVGGTEGEFEAEVLYFMDDPTLILEGEQPVCDRTIYGSAGEAEVEFTTLESEVDESLIDPYVEILVFEDGGEFEGGIDPRARGGDGGEGEGLEPLFDVSIAFNMAPVAAPESSPVESIDPVADTPATPEALAIALSLGDQDNAAYSWVEESASTGSALGDPAWEDTLGTEEDSGESALEDGPAASQAPQEAPLGEVSFTV